MGRLVVGGLLALLVAMAVFAVAYASRERGGFAAAPAAAGDGAKRVAHPRVAAPQASTTDASRKVKKSDRDWRKLLTVEQFRVMRQAGTEPPFLNRYWDFHGDGLFVCAGCGLELFDTKAKFDSGTGWPSFWQPIAADRVAEKADNSYGMRRVEVLCARCDAHLGHVFDDGPRPTGLRYCMNSASMTFADRAAVEAAHRKQAAEDATAAASAETTGGN